MRATSVRPGPRVLWITGNFKPEVGGLQVYTDRLLEALTPYCRLGLITAAWQQPPSERSICHFPIEGIGRPDGVSGWAKVERDIIACVRAHAADIVHFANANVAVYRPAIAAMLPTVATVHGNDLTAPWQATPGREPVPSIVEGLNNCAHVIAVSRHTAMLVRRFGVRSRVTILHHGCDTDFFCPLDDAGAATRRHYGIDQTVPLLLTVARLVERKGHSTIMDALAQLPFRAHWIVVGDGPNRQYLWDRIATCGLSDRVTLTGIVSDEELRALYNACDVFVLVPRERVLDGRLDSEGFGLVFLEAAACGKPVIGSDVSGCRDAVVQNETGLLVPPDDPTALAEAIDFLFQEPSTAAGLGARARAHIRAAGGWARVARQLAGLYSDVLTDVRSERTLMKRYRV